MEAMNIISGRKATVFQHQQVVTRRPTLKKLFVSRLPDNPSRLSWIVKISIPIACSSVNGSFAAPTHDRTMSDSSGLRYCISHNLAPFQR